MTQTDRTRIDKDKVDDATLALLRLTLHDRDRVWKSFRLHEKGLISDPRGKQKSVLLTEEGQARAEALFREMFAPPQ